MRAVRKALATGLAVINELEQDVIRERARLILAVPQLRARLYEQSKATEALIAEQIAPRLLPMSATSRCEWSPRRCPRALVVAVERWVADGGDLPSLLERALAVLETDLP